jgi:hypothetical protein
VGGDFLKQPTKRTLNEQPQGSTLTHANLQVSLLQLGAILGHAHTAGDLEQQQPPAANDDTRIRKKNATEGRRLNFSTADHANQADRSEQRSRNGNWVLTRPRRRKDPAEQLESNAIHGFLTAGRRRDRSKAVGGRDLPSAAARERRGRCSEGGEREEGEDSRWETWYRGRTRLDLAMRGRIWIPGNWLSGSGRLVVPGHDWVGVEPSSSPS